MLAKKMTTITLLMAVILATGICEAGVNKAIRFFPGTNIYSKI